MRNTLLLDIGSSSVKAYSYTENKLSLISTCSINFKSGFIVGEGIAADHKAQLFEFISHLRSSYPHYPIKTYATAFFRKMPESVTEHFTEEFYAITGVPFNIISHEDENHYLELALAGKYEIDKPVLLVNIGGGSTELVIVRKHIAVERVNIELGVATLIKNFSRINEPLSGHELMEVVTFVKDTLPEMNRQIDEAFYSGGELRYMQVAGYPLKKNTLFPDDEHPFVIDTISFKNKNLDIFSKITLSVLETCMPDNPRWMHGARACSALAQGIFEKYSIQTIIPSNANLIDGVVRSDTFLSLSGV